jgi:hypothetical protein
MHIHQGNVDQLKTDDNLICIESEVKTNSQFHGYTGIVSNEEFF